MSGYGSITIPPSEAVVAPANIPVYSSGVWQRAVPPPGVASTTPPVPAAKGIATCQNLFALSPPTLLEAYEIYSYAIGWGIWFYRAGSPGFPAAPNTIAEMALLVNDEPRFVTTQDAVAALDATGNNAMASGTWIGDLVNPVTVGARERLSLRVGLVPVDQNPGQESIVVGAQYNFVPPGALVFSPYPSTLAYRVLDLPGSRRL